MDVTAIGPHKSEWISFRMSWDSVLLEGKGPLVFFPLSQPGQHHHVLIGFLAFHKPSSLLWVVPSNEDEIDPNQKGWHGGLLRGVDLSGEPNVTRGFVSCLEDLLKYNVEKSLKVLIRPILVWYSNPH